MASYLQSAMPIAREALCSSVAIRSIFGHPIRLFTRPTSVLSYRVSNRLQFSRQYTQIETHFVPKQCHRIRSSQLVALEYSDLNLPHNSPEEIGHVRIRQHVNPLSAAFMNPVEVPDWNEVFKDAKLPLMVDIGSGSGRFLMWLAKKNPDSKNYLGLEIRKKLALRAESWAKERGLNNVHYMFANAVISFKQLVSTYPGPLMLVSILCPDPHFKKKHHKRRVLQKPLVDSIVDSIAPGGQVFIQSDVLEVALDMRNHFDAESDKLPHINTIDSTVVCDDEGWLLSNPMGIRTEREIHAESEGAKIYRRMYQKLT